MTVIEQPRKGIKNYLSKDLVIYLLKFGGLFCVFYFGTLLIIGLSSKDHYYSPFVAKYFDYVTPLRDSILAVSEFFLSAFGHYTKRVDAFTIRLTESGESVRLVYSCVGYGVMSFWAAFVFANQASFLKSVLWLLVGWTVLYLINVGRICLLLLSLRENGVSSFPLEHHTMFNLVAYGFIFLLIYFYGRSERSTNPA